MANDQDSNKVNISALKKIATQIQANSDKVYKSTYFSDPNDKKQLMALKKDISNSVKQIMNNTSDNIGEPNISRMYERILLKRQNDSGTTAEFKKIFEDNEFMNSLTNSYLDNRYVKLQDEEIDEVTKYMPKLEEAILTLKDNVLSADSFSKDFLSLKNKLDSNQENVSFSDNIAELKTKYNLLEVTEECYYNASKYGEAFIYAVPYSVAIQKLLDTKSANPGAVSIRSNMQEGTIITESAGIETKESFKDLDLQAQDFPSINFVVDKSGFIASAVKESKMINDKYEIAKNSSLYEQYLTEQAVQEGVEGNKYVYDRIDYMDIDPEKKTPTHNRYDKTLDDDLELPLDFKDKAATDGLVDSNRKKKIKSINGCILKILDRDKVVPIYINEVCLGYYYFEFDTNVALYEDRYATTGLNNTINGLRSGGRAQTIDANQRKEELLQFISSKLSEYIDADFVNANQDLKKEIYYILKSNDDFQNTTNSTNNIRCTYIPPEDIHHIFFKQDKQTNRGISDLALSLIPAKLWCSIYITNCLAVMTRSNDKRVYYVKQSVESNIAKTMLKTINEIKKSNFGMRQIENINNVLNITGRFNDLIVPRSADGQSPIDFEVMQGQQVEIKTELLNLLEESAINITGVPIEIIQSRQSPDYAVQLTMQNSKFLRFIYGRQADFQRQLSKLYSKIYNIEYGTNELIEVTLPPPLFVNITNTNQLIENTSQYCDNIANIMFANQDDEVKALFSKKLKIYNLGSYLNMQVIDNLMNQAKQEASRNAELNKGSEDNGEQ